MRVASVEPVQPVARYETEARQPRLSGLALSRVAGACGEGTLLPPCGSGALAAVSPGGAAPALASGREANKLLQAVWPPGRSAVDLQQKGSAVALDPVRALECESPLAMVPSSGGKSQERRADWEAPRDLAPNVSFSRLSVRLEPGGALPRVRH